MPRQSQTRVTAAIGGAVAAPPAGGASALPVPPATTAASLRRAPWNASTRLRPPPPPDHQQQDLEQRSTEVLRPESEGSTFHNEHPTASTGAARCRSPVVDRKQTQRKQNLPPQMKLLPSVARGYDRDGETQRTAQISSGAHDRATVSTRDMIERAVDVVLSSAMSDGISFDASIEDMTAASLTQQPQSQLNTAPLIVNGTQGLLCQLGAASAQGLEWRLQYDMRKKSREQEDSASKTVAQQHLEFHRIMRSARFEYDQRKLALQSLRARVAREVQFLLTTAAELEKRECILDDAFATYEQVLRHQHAGGVVNARDDNARAG